MSIEGTKDSHRIEFSAEMVQADQMKAPLQILKFRSSGLARNSRRSVSLGLRGSLTKGSSKAAHGGDQKL